jgi:electron transport complex protein RnfC
MTMMKKPFFGLAAPRFTYAVLTGKLPKPKVLPHPKTVTLLIEAPFADRDPSLLKPGEPVTCGQKLTHAPNGDAYTIATVNGTITATAPLAGDFGRRFTAVTVSASDQPSDEQQAETSLPVPSADTAFDQLMCVPGAPPLMQFKDPEEPFHTLVVYGGDTDLLVTTNQFVFRSRLEQLKGGIEAFKQITGVERVIVAIPGETVQGYGDIGAEVKSVAMDYPSAFPQMIMKDVLGRTIRAGRSPSDYGVAFFTAEAVAAIGEFFQTGRYPVRKLLTVVDKSGQQHMVSAVIGTPIGEVLTAVGITVEDRDRLVIGGPMTGSAVYSEDFPVTPETGALIVQDHSDVALVSDYPCINCGDCIRVCPVNIPVNMLVRFLEAGHYEEAVDQYDLYSCIDCGLCSFVCVSKIPIFQYIRLAKYELGRMKAAEAGND